MNETNKDQANVEVLANQLLHYTVTQRESEITATTQSLIRKTRELVDVMSRTPRSSLEELFQPGGSSLVRALTLAMASLEKLDLLPRSRIVLPNPVNGSPLPEKKNAVFAVLVALASTTMTIGHDLGSTEAQQQNPNATKET